MWLSYELTLPRTAHFGDREIENVPLYYTLLLAKMLYIIAENSNSVGRQLKSRKRVRKELGSIASLDLYLH